MLPTGVSRRAKDQKESMKTHHLPVIATLGAVILIVGCTAGMKSLVSPTTPDQPPRVAGPAVGQDATASRPTPPSPSGPEERSGTPLKYAPPTAPDQKQTPPTLDLGEKDEVNQAGLKFAENIAGVKHVKTCYSRLYGGWYLFLYLQKGKQISLQQYSWNRKTKEWEVIYHLKSIDAEKLEHHLKTELDDEKCFVLK